MLVERERKDNDLRRSGQNFAMVAMKASISDSPKTSFIYLSPLSVKSYGFLIFFLTTS